ncbi:MAG: TolC family outer membrane protein [Pseudomonadales bacterium]
MKSLLRPLFVAMALCVGPMISYADTLADIYELALQNDATLKKAEATYKADLELEKQAFSSLLPTIVASGSYQEEDTDTKGFNRSTLTQGSTNSETETTTYNVSLQQNIFNLSAWYSFQSGKETTKKAAAQFAFDQQDLIVRVAEAYFDVLRALDNLEASKAEERATKRQLEQTQQRFDVGLIAITDVHEARAVYDSTVVQRLTDEGNLGTSYESLTVLTNRTHANLWLLNKDFPVVDPDPVARDEWVKFALKNNHALKAALYAMESSRQQASAKKMGHVPTITGSFSYTDTDNGIDQTPSPPFDLDSETEGTSWGLELKIPLYSGGLISSQRRQAYEHYNIALQNKIDTQRTVIRNTRASHITVTTDVQRVNARAQAITSTSSALDATQAGYEVGTRNIVDVLQAQRALYSSIRDYANSRYNYVLNMLKLKRAAGTLTPQDIYAINQWIVAPDAPTANQYQEYLSR